MVANHYESQNEETDEAQPNYDQPAALTWHEQEINTCFISHWPGEVVCCCSKNWPVLWILVVLGWGGRLWESMEEWEASDGMRIEYGKLPRCDNDKTLVMYPGLGLTFDWGIKFILDFLLFDYPIPPCYFSYPPISWVSQKQNPPFYSVTCHLYWCLLEIQETLCLKCVRILWRQWVNAGAFSHTVAHPAGCSAFDRIPVTWVLQGCFLCLFKIIWNIKG